MAAAAARCVVVAASASASLEHPPAADGGADADAFDGDSFVRSWKHAASEAPAVEELIRRGCTCALAASSCGAAELREGRRDGNALVTEEVVVTEGNEREAAEAAMCSKAQFVMVRSASL